MSKKLLSEAEMRRFMGLAGINSSLISNRIDEAGMHAYNEEDDDPADDPVADLDAPTDDLEDAAPQLDEPEMVVQPADMPAPEDDALGGLSDEAKEELFTLVMQATGDALDMDVEVEGSSDPAAPEDAGPVDPMAPVDDEEEAADLEEPPPALDAEDEEAPLALSEEEIVNEVARRVAKRLVRASKASKTLKEALGRK